MEQAPNDARNRDHLFISYATEDAALAEWLALRLTAEGYKVWIDRFELLGGERFPHDIDEAIKRKTFRLLHLVSRHSMNKPNPTKERTLALNIGRAREIDFLIPLNVEGIPAEELNWMLTDLTYVPFSSSWARGLAQLLKKLGRLNAPREVTTGRQIAAGIYLPDDILTSESELLFSNLVPLASVPDVVHRFRWSRALSTLEQSMLAEAWPNHAVEETDVLRRKTISYAFEPPPRDVVRNFVGHKDGGTVWQESDRIDGLPRWQVVRPLLTRTLVRSMRGRGLHVTPGRVHDFFFPTGLLPRDKITYKSYRGRKVPLQVAGQRTFRGTEKFGYNVGFQMTFIRLQHNVMAAKFRTRIRISNSEGKTLDSHVAAHARRKTITRTWFNEKRLNLELAILSFLADGGDVIDLGSGLKLSAQPITHVAPFGIDEGRLPKGRRLFRRSDDGG